LVLSQQAGAGSLIAQDNGGKMMVNVLRKVIKR
jgi:hypothetical protein